MHCYLFITNLLLSIGFATASATKHFFKSAGTRQPLEVMTDTTRAKLDRMQQVHLAVSSSTNFAINQLALFSPLTWSGVVELRPDVRWKWKQLLQGAAGVIVPPIVYFYIQLLGGFEHRRVRLNSVSLCSFKSVWTELCHLAIQHRWFFGLYTPPAMAFGWRGSAGLRSVGAAVWSICRFSGNQSTTKPVARKILLSRVASKRAYRRRRYDVYLPPAADAEGEGILLLPGFGVEHVAYSDVAAQLSDLGFLVIVVSAEPLRAPSQSLGCSARELTSYQRSVQRQHNVSKWSLVGHSMGAFTATQLAQPLNISRVVLWGAAPAFADGIAQDEHFQSRTQVLVVEGSEDIVIKLFVKTKEEWETFRRRLPSGYETKTIKGGTHSGFGSYVSSRLVEESSIGDAEQHKHVVEHTARFLRRHR